MSKLQDRRRVLPEVIAIKSDEIGRMDAEEHRSDGVGSDAENEIVEV